MLLTGGEGVDPPAAVVALAMHLSIFFAKLETY